MSQYCSCGNGKYDDAACCDSCWNKGSKYDSPTDQTRCQCGSPKLSDASLCTKCWNKQRVYWDGRDG